MTCQNVGRHLQRDGSPRLRFTCFSPCAQCKPALHSALTGRQLRQQQGGTRAETQDRRKLCACVGDGDELRSRRSRGLWGHLHRSLLPLRACLLFFVSSAALRKLNASDGLLDAPEKRRKPGRRKRHTMVALIISPFFPSLLSLSLPFPSSSRLRLKFHTVRVSTIQLHSSLLASQGGALFFKFNLRVFIFSYSPPTSSPHCVPSRSFLFSSRRPECCGVSTAGTIVSC